MSIHHAITDGWSSGQFLKALFALYAALKGGKTPPNPPVDRVYKEFVALEKETMAWTEARTFWRNFLRPARYQPLKQRPLKAVTASPGPQMWPLDKRLAGALTFLARQAKVPLRTIFLSAYLELIAEESGQPVVTVGLVANGRSERLSNPLEALGLFWYMIPFCHRTDPEEKMLQIERIQKKLVELEPYLQYPLTKILNDRGRPDLFFATLNFAHFHNTQNLGAGGDLQILNRKEYDKFHYPLNYAIGVDARQGQITLTVSYDNRYFGARTIAALGARYLAILQALRP